MASRIQALNHSLDSAWAVMADSDTAIYEPLRRVIQHIIWLKLGRSDEDLAQDIQIEIFKALQSFDGKSAFSTWVFVVASNHIIDTLRAARLREYPIELAENIPVEPTTTQNWEIELARLGAQVKDEVDKVILAGKLVGYSNTEIGKSVDLTKRQVIRRWVALCERLRWEQDSEIQDSK